MSGITVYGIPGSPFMRAVEITLKEKGLDYRLHALAPGEHKQPEHLARHPFGRVPAFEHDGFMIFPQPPLTPGNPKQRARMNQVIGIIEWYFFPKAAAPIAFNRIIGPRLLGTTPDEAAIADAMPMARQCFAELDRLLGDQPYFTGNAVSIADIMLAAQLDLFGECPEGRALIDGTQHLRAWLQRMIARPSFAATEPPAVLREAA
jgi:glutathione S-transferase